MNQKNGHKSLRYLLVLPLIFGLVLVRFFEEQLFYDPFLAYFKGEFLGKVFPDFQLGKVIFHVIFRYALNGILSLGIIGLLFWDLRKVQFTALILLGFLVILLPLYIYMIQNHFSLGENIGFYIRRFLIQPMLVLILIPAFYYQHFLQLQQKD